MVRFNLEKEGKDFFLTLYVEGLTTPSGAISIKTNTPHRVSKTAYPRPGMSIEDLVVLGNKIVLKTDLYDFLRDERKEVVSGPRGGGGNK